MSLPIVERSIAERIVKNYQLKFLKEDGGNSLRQTVEAFVQKQPALSAILKTAVGSIVRNTYANEGADLFGDYETFETIKYGTDAPLAIGSIGGLVVCDILTASMENAFAIPFVSADTVLSFRKSLKENRANYEGQFPSKLMDFVDRRNPSIAYALRSLCPHSLFELPVLLSGAITYHLLERQAETDDLEKKIT